jgi:hypothetical protein
MQLLYKRAPKTKNQDKRGKKCASGAKSNILGDVENEKMFR